MDESYIHKNYHWHEDPLFEIIGVFGGGKKKTVDFHGMFDSTYFIAWMQNLLDSLETINVQNDVIVINNAKYNTILSKNTPKAIRKKQQLVYYCLEKGLDLEENNLKTAIWGRIQLYIRDHDKPVFITMAYDAGHTVMWPPTHNSDLQTIELVWSNAKGTKGRRYTITTTLSDVKSRINSAFATLDTKTVCLAAKIRLTILWRNCWITLWWWMLKKRTKIIQTDLMMKVIMIA